MTVLLLDASVWLAALDDSDPRHEPSFSLIEAGGSRPIAALDLTLYEVANVVVSGWCSPQLIAPAIALIREASDPNLVRIDDLLLQEAAQLAVEAGLSVYDAAYAACALRRGWILVSSDVRDLVRPGFAITPEQAVADAR